ncbi:hypothetical protein OAL55_01850 [Verrucomicrobiales bacterium]|nr:hypothetical protein [Verrucomicrobiales bacterium]
MTDQAALILCFPFVFALIGVVLKFLLMCQKAREEEFTARKEAVALAKICKSN